MFRIRACVRKLFAPIYDGKYLEPLNCFKTPKLKWTILQLVMLLSFAAFCAFPSSTLSPPNQENSKKEKIGEQEQHTHLIVVI